MTIQFLFVSQTKVSTSRNQGEQKKSVCVYYRLSALRSCFIWSKRKSLSNHTTVASMTTLFNLGEITLSQFSPVTVLLI